MATDVCMKTSLNFSLDRLDYFRHFFLFQKYFMTSRSKKTSQVDAKKKGSSFVPLQSAKRKCN